MTEEQRRYRLAKVERIPMAGLELETDNLMAALGAMEINNGLASCIVSNPHHFEVEEEKDGEWQVVYGKIPKGFMDMLSDLYGEQMLNNARFFDSSYRAGFNAAVTITMEAMRRFEGKEVD